MGFQQRIPAAPLDGLVEKIWDWDMPPATHHYERVLPQPGAALIINLHEDETRSYADDAMRTCTRSAAAILGGPMLHSQILDTAEQVRVMGVMFRPGGAAALTGADFAGMIGRDIDLHDIFGTTADRLRQRLLETRFAGQRLALLENWLQRHMRSGTVDPAVRQAIALLEQIPQVARMPHIAQATGVSGRGLAQRFRRQVGMNPKHYARLARFRAVIVHAQGRTAVDWSAVAADCRYADQAHLSHEFRRFAGVTPTAFMTMRGPYPNHLPLD